MKIKGFIEIVDGEPKSVELDMRNYFGTSARKLGKIIACTIEYEDGKGEE